MQFTISCEQFSRLSKAAYVPGEDLGKSPEGIPHPQRPALASITLESDGSKLFAMATNSLVMAIELIGQTNEPAGSLMVKTDPALIAQCDTEKMLDSDLVITFEPVLGVAFAATTLGYKYPGDIKMQLPWPVPHVKWRDLVLEPPAKSDTAFTVNAVQMARLAATAPTGNFVYPKHVTQKQPVIVRDVIDPNWIGIFLNRGGNPYPYATIPDWLK